MATLISRNPATGDVVGEVAATPAASIPVFGGDLDRADGVARRLTAGMVGINRARGGAERTPRVGAQENGYGFHRSRDGHRRFTQTRVVSRPRPAA